MTGSQRTSPMNPDLPVQLADCFIATMADRGIVLQLDLATLEHEFELALDEIDRQTNALLLPVDGVSYDLETGAACFFGVVLGRQFSGEWLGELRANSGVNYYYVQIRFGDYSFNPFSWLGYRTTHGRELPARWEIACER